MNILIIGNGFDLAHGLPTTYNDFLKFIKFAQKNADFINDYEAYIELKKEYNKMLRYEKNRYENLKSLMEKAKQNNIWISYFTQLMENEKEKMGKNWIDIEKELQYLIKAKPVTNTVRDTIYKTKKNIMLNILDTQISGKKKVKITFLEKELSKFINILENYILLIVNNIDVEKVFNRKVKLKIDKVLSFNYSNTYERIYENDNVDYIHGKAGKNNIVLGIDEYLEGDEKNKNLEYIFFKKYYQRIYKKTSYEYTKWIDEIKRIIEIENSKAIPVSHQRHNLYIIGHSLDVTDIDVLKKFIMQEHITTHVYYYNEDDHRSKISNLIQVIEQDNVIKKVYGNNPSLVFKNLNEIK